MIQGCPRHGPGSRRRQQALYAYVFVRVRDQLISGENHRSAELGITMTGSKETYAFSDSSRVKRSAGSRGLPSRRLSEHDDLDSLYGVDVVKLKDNNIMYTW